MRATLMRLHEWTHVKLPRYVDCRPIYVREALEEAGFEVLDATHVSIWGLTGEVVLGKKA